MNNSIRPITFHTFADEIVALYTAPQKRPKTLSKVCQVLAELAELCSTTADLSPATIAGWLAAHAHRRATTHKSLLGTARAICGYGDFRGYLTSPFTYRGLAGWLPADELVTEPFPRHRSAEEIARVLHQADAEAAAGDWHARRLRALVYLLAFTGCHDAEARGLRVADVALAERMLEVRSHHRRRLKTGARVAPLPIAEPLAEVLDGWIPETGGQWLIPGSRRTGPWNGGPPGYRPLDRVKQLGRRAGVDDLTIIAFRHTVGTEGDRWGFGENELQGLLRHARPSTQQHYRRRVPAILKETAGKIHYPRPSPPLPRPEASPPITPGG